MANLPEVSQFDAGVTQIETNEPVVGGLAGVSNRALKQLANRTKWLKDQIDGLVDVGGLLDAYALKNGDYTLLRARGTTKTDVDLGSVNNWVATSDPNDGSPVKYATAAAVKVVNDAVLGLDFSSSLGAAGYQILPSGLILQWGSVTMTSGQASVPVVYPIAFNTVYAVTMGGQQGSDNQNNPPTVSGLPGASSFTIKNVLNPGGDITAWWMALGI